MYSLINKLNWLRYRKRLSRIKFIVVDVDGVLTDGGLWYDDKGGIIKRFNVRDGLGIRLLKDAGIEVIFLSGGSGGSTQSRAKSLGITSCLVGVKDKCEALIELSLEKKFSLKNTLYVGDDLNDLVVKKDVSLLVCPSDASTSVLKQAHLILTNKGGDGAIRELSERILKISGFWRKLDKNGWKDRNE